MSKFQNSIFVFVWKNELTDIWWTK